MTETTTTSNQNAASNIFGVLSGSAPLKGELSISTKNVAMVAGIVLLTIIVGVLILKKIK